MELILLQDVERLGHKDDIVKVKDGYGRNYLVPKKLAMVATVPARKTLAENQKQRVHKETKQRDEALSVAEKLKNKSIKIGAKISSSGKIFGSVNTIQLAEAINKKGFEIDRKQIMLPEDSIKEVGTYNAKIKLHRDVVVEIEFEVVGE